MPVVNPLKGREVPGHKYIKRIMGKNGKWQYVYEKAAGKDRLDSSARTRVSNDRSASSGDSKPGKYTGKTSSWVKSYYETKNKKVSAISSEQVEAGKAAASGKVRTSGSASTQKWDTSVARAQIADDIPTKEQYKEAADKLETESNQKITENENYYKNLYEQEKESIRNKLISGLKAKNSGDIPDSEMSKINEQVEKETKTLWDEVYKPMVDKVNDVIKDNRDSVLRVLRKKYNQDQ